VIYTVNTGCNAPVSARKTISISLFPYAGIVSGNSPVCAGTTTTYSSNGSAGGIWTSSNNAVATVNSSTGLVTTVGAGSAVITYSVRSCLGSASSSKTIVVNPNTVPNAGAITGASPLCRNVTVTYSSNGNTGGVWTSSNTAVATVNAGTGVVKTLTAGTTNITYTVTPTCGNPVKAIKALTVNTCTAFANNGNTSSQQSRGQGNVEEGKKEISQPDATRSLGIETYPNPSSSTFTLLLKGYSNDKVTIVVTNLLGNKVYQTEGLMRQQYVFGNDFAPGIYLVQVLQGNSKQSMKLIKQ